MHVVFYFLLCCVGIRCLKILFFLIINWYLMYISKLLLKHIRNINDFYLSMHKTGWTQVKCSTTDEPYREKVIHFNRPLSLLGKPPSQCCSLRKSIFASKKNISELFLVWLWYRINWNLSDLFFGTKIKIDVTGEKCICY